MNNFIKRIFVKNVKVRVNFIDLDQNDEVLASSDELEGKPGDQIEFDPAEQISQLRHKGYVLANNDFNANGAPVFEKDVNEYTIAFHHDQQVRKVEHKKLQQIVHYVGVAGRTPDDNVTELTFDHYQKVDVVTEKAIEDQGWRPEKQNFMLVGTPTLPGFVPDQTVVGGNAVTADDDNQEYTVTFTVNNTPSNGTQAAEVRYVDLNNDNQVIMTKQLNGQPNMPIEYDSQEEINELEEQGFVLVHNGFNAGGDVQFFGNQDSYVPVFIITLKNTAVAVNLANPNKQVDPSEYTKTSTFTVNFTGVDNPPKPVVQTATWNRTVTLLPDKKQLDPEGYYNTDWQADIEHYENVQVPVVAGYHVEKSEVAAPELTQEDQTVTVNYVANAHIIPVDEAGQEITDADHPQIVTDPEDASKAAKDEIIPDIKGYQCDLMTVTPSDPGEDLQVTYKAKQKQDTMYIDLTKDKQKKQADDEAASEAPKSEEPKEKAATEESAEETGDKSKLKDQVAIINFIDVDHNGTSLTSSGPLVGKPGDSINALYSTELPLKMMKKAGYHVVFNNFDSDGFVQRFDNNHVMTQIFTIGLSKKKQTGDLANLMLADGTPNIEQLKKTTDELEKIKPELLPQGTSAGNSQTVSRLLDIVTALLNLIFVLGNNKNSQNKDKKD